MKPEHETFLSPRELALCLALAQQAAQEAGARILELYHAGVRVASKGKADLAGDVVTRADVEAQAIIERRLLDLFPQKIGAVMEEGDLASSTSRLERPYHWSVDPMDSTLSFVYRMRGFCTSIALLRRDGSHELGVAYFPDQNDLYTAVRGEGSFLNGLAFGPPRPAPGAHTVLWVSPSDVLPDDRHARLARVVAGLGDGGPVKLMVQHGAVDKALRAVRFAPGAWLSFERPAGQGTSIWDHAAAAALVLEAGGWVSDLRGLPLSLNPKEGVFAHAHGVLYASSEALARRILSCVTPGLCG